MFALAAVLFSSTAFVAQGSNEAALPGDFYKNQRVRCTAPLEESSEAGWTVSEGTEGYIVGRGDHATELSVQFDGDEATWDVRPDGITPVDISGRWLSESEVPFVFKQHKSKLTGYVHDEKTCKINGEILRNGKIQFVQSWSEHDNDFPGEKSDTEGHFENGNQERLKVKIKHTRSNGHTLEAKGTLLRVKAFIVKKLAHLTEKEKEYAADPKQIGYDELRKIFQELIDKKSIEKQTLRNFFIEYDHNKDGTLNIDEFQEMENVRKLPTDLRTPPPIRNGSEQRREVILTAQDRVESISGGYNYDARQAILPRSSLRSELQRYRNSCRNEWACKVCTFKNDGESDKCKMCGSSQHDEGVTEDVVKMQEALLEKYSDPAMKYNSHFMDVCRKYDPHRYDRAELARLERIQRQVEAMCNDKNLKSRSLWEKIKAEDLFWDKYCPKKTKWE